MDPIQLFVPTFHIEEDLAQIRECLEKGWTGLGFKTVEFEAAWRAYTGFPHAHFLGSATSGLHLAVRLLKEEGQWEEGDEVITTPMTFVSSNHAILYEKLKPVFADVDEYLCLDPESIAQRITPRTKAVCFVGLGGNAGRLLEVANLCKERGLKLILDASHMTGSRWQNGKHIGQEADVSVFSFQAVKNLPTADSGMICFMNAHLDEEVRKWSWLGINKDTYSRTAAQGAYKWYYDVDHEGFKYHGNSIMAAIGLVELKYVDQTNSYRRQISAWYDEMLKSNDHIRRIPVVQGCVSSRHLYQVMVDRRDEVMLALNQAKIFPGVHYRDNTLYKMYSYANGTCPQSQYASDHIISLPMHMRLDFQQVQYVAETLMTVVNHLVMP